MQEKVLVASLMSRLSAIIVAVVMTCGAAYAVPKGFTVDFDGALQSAKSSGKQLWVLFTGSDWHKDCKVLEQKVLKRCKFAASGSECFELVYIDFPLDKSGCDSKFELGNLALLNRYHVDSYPTVLVIDPDGREVFKAECPDVKEPSQRYFEKIVERSRRLTAIRYLEPLKTEFARITGGNAPTSEKKIVRMKNGRLALRDAVAVDVSQRNIGPGHVSRLRAIIASVNGPQMPMIIADECRKAAAEMELKICQNERIAVASARDSGGKLSVCQVATRH